MRSLSRPLSVSKEAVQLVDALGAGRRSVLPEAAPVKMKTQRLDQVTARGNNEKLQASCHDELKSP